MPLVTNIAGTGGSFANPTSGDEVNHLVEGGTLPADNPYPVDEALIAANTTPLPGEPNDVLAALTDDGRNLIARQLVEGVGFKVIGFRVGRGGYDPSNPLNPLPLVDSAGELDDPLYPVMSLDPKSIDRYEAPNDYGMSYLCRVPSAEAIAGLGEIGIYAEITYSPVSSEIGDQLLMAHCHRPLFGKCLSDVLVWRIVFQF